MSEGLISRVTRIVSGSANGLIDAIENAAPEMVMREAIKEIDDAISDVRAALGRAMANRHHANKRMMDTASKHEELADQIKLAVDQGRDDLAEAAIARQLDLEAQMPVLENALKDMAEKQSEHEGFVSALLARKREMETELDSFLATEIVSVTGEPCAKKSAAANNVNAEEQAEKAEQAFNRVLKGATSVGGTAAIDNDAAAKLMELEKVAHQHRVKERLAEIKAMKA